MSLMLHINRSTLLTAFGVLAVGHSALATVTLQFTVLSGSIAANFGNAMATDATGGTNQMTWGIIIDTERDGFLMDFQPFNPTTAQGSVLTRETGMDDDFYFRGPANGTVNTSANTEAPPPNGGGAPGGSGTITTIANVPFGINNIDQGDPFGLIWFSSNSANGNDRFGFFQHSSFVIPANGTNPNLSAVFAGVDPVRASAFAVVPEPTSAVLLSFGIAALISRRKR